MPRKPRRLDADTPTTCPGCGSDQARVIQRVQKFVEPDVSGTYKDEITECPACGESIFTYEQGVASDKSYAAAVARARNVPTPDRLYDLRLSLGWSQEQMNAAFGVGAKTWGRWENGIVPPSGPAARLIWLAENDRAEFLRMVDAHKPTHRRIAMVSGISGSIEPQGPGERAIGFKAAKRVVRAPVTTGEMGSSGNGGAV